MSEFLFFYPKRQIETALVIRGFAVVRGRKPVPTRIRVVEFDESRSQLVVDAKTDLSAALYVPCSGGREGFFYASTETLPSDRRPRPLYLELCRGQLSRIQRKRAEWSYSGFSTPERLRSQIRRAVQKFSVLVTADYDAPDYDAETFALFNSLCEIARRLNELYLSQTLAARRRTASWVSRFGFATNPHEKWTPSYDALFVGSKSNHTRPKLEQLFQTVNIRVNWREIERHGSYDWSRVSDAVDAARERNLRVTLGPMTRWGTDLPSALQSSTIDADTLRGEFTKFLRTAVHALGDRVDRWIVATNVETSPDLPTFEFRLSNAMQAADYVRNNLPRSEAFLGLEQAFGDTSRFRDPPLVYAVDLAARLAQRHAFDGYYVETNFGLVPNTTAPRDPMELHRFFDRWRMIGVKLAVATSCPSAAPFATPNSLEPSELFTTLFADKQKRSFFFRQTGEGKALEELVWDVQVQQEFARRFYSSALACKAIDELIWTRWLDAKLMSYDEYSELVSVFDGAESPAPFEQTVVDGFAYAQRRDEDDFFGRDDFDDERQAEDDFFGDGPFDEELFDEIELASSDASFHSRSESVSFSAEIDAPENFTPTSGLLDAHGRPKPTLYKLAALRRAYLDA